MNQTSNVPYKYHRTDDPKTQDCQPDPETACPACGKMMWEVVEKVDDGHVTHFWECDCGEVVC